MGNLGPGGATRGVRIPPLARQLTAPHQRFRGLEDVGAAVRSRGVATAPVGAVEAVDEPVQLVEEQVPYRLGTSPL